MRYFRIIYLVTAVVTTVGVYALAPYVAPYIPDFVKPVPAPAQGSGSNQSSSPGLVLKRGGRTVIPPTGGRDIGEGSATDSTPATRPRVELSRDDETPPELNNIFLAKHSDTPGWGITHKPATVYHLNGVRAGKVDAGVLVEFRSRKSSSKGAMIECIVIMGEQRSQPVLLGAAELYLFTESYRKLSERQLSALQEYYAASGKILERKNTLLQIAASKNPHFLRYEAAYKKLMEHIRRAKELSAERDKVSGAAKMRIEDQLRVMKHEEGQIRKEYDAIHIKFRAWKEANSDAVAKPDQDPEIAELQKTMTALRTYVPGLAL